MRLKSTKAIFNGRLQTTYNLLVKTDAQITADYHAMNALKGRIARSIRQSTLESLKSELAILSAQMGHAAPIKSDKKYLLNKINVYKKQNNFLLYAAIHQAIINICVTYEDLIKRIILKYYEEDIRRLPSQKEGLKNSVLIEAILRGDNIHRTLAEKTADDLMYGSVDKWHNELKNQKMNLITSSHLIELFLIRNCFVHNNNRASSQLHQHMPRKYPMRKPIRLELGDVKIFKDEVHKTASFIMSEYSRLHPINRGSWL